MDPRCAGKGSRIAVMRQGRPHHVEFLLQPHDACLSSFGLGGKRQIR